MQLSFPLPETIAKELDTIQKLLFELIQTNDSHINNILSYVFQNTGKKIRPTLFLLWSHALGFITKNTNHVATALEYIHVASLIHDDIIDQAEFRRNHLTVHKKWNAQTAILLGDFIFSFACQIFVKTHNIPLLAKTTECITAMSQAELQQTAILWKDSINLEELWNIVIGKTAKLFSLCCEAPALLNPDFQFLAPSCAEFGKNLGICFQLIDDIMDITESPDTLGKPTGNDLKEGKITIPLALAIQNDPSKNLQKKVAQYFELRNQELLFDILQLARENLNPAYKLVEKKLEDAINILTSTEKLLPSSQQKKYINILKEFATALCTKIS